MTPTPATLADALYTARNGRSSREDCQRDVATALALAASPGPSYVTAVRVAGVRLGRAKPF